MTQDHEVFEPGVVGTGADASWAIDFYKKHGSRLMPNKDEAFARILGHAQASGRDFGSSRC